MRLETEESIRIGVYLYQDTVIHLKYEIQKRRGLQPDQQQLFYDDVILLDEDRLSDSNIKRESTILLKG